MSSKVCSTKPSKLLSTQNLQRLLFIYTSSTRTTFRLSLRFRWAPFYRRLILPPLPLIQSFTHALRRLLCHKHRVENLSTFALLFTNDKSSDKKGCIDPSISVSCPSSPSCQCYPRSTVHDFNDIWRFLLSDSSVRSYDFTT